ncbi:MAG: replicative DNA helicase [bacterium]|nr:replicative DNA helicase [bacterium]
MNQLPPHNIEFEESALASCLQSSEDLDDFTSFLKPSDFYSPKHQTIFRAILRLYSRSEPVDARTVAEALVKAGELEKAGGGVFISSLLDLPPAMDAEHYSKKIRGYAIKRRLIEASNAIKKTASKPEIDAEEALATAEAFILGIEEGSRQADSFALSDLAVDASDRLFALQQRDGSLSGITTGYIDLDESTCGFQKADLTILAARPSMGKTALAVNMALHAAKLGYPSGFFSLEMSRDQITNRFLSVLSGVNLFKFKSGRFSGEDWKKITAAQEMLFGLSGRIDDAPGLSCSELRRRARRMKSRHGIEILFVDYLQLMQGDKQSGRVEEISGISRNLKACAKELDIPVVCLSQLNRALENRDNKRPKLSDLRDSGAIEQDADLVMFIYRDEVYKKNSDKKGIAEIDIAKQRNGPTGPILLTWNAATASFHNSTNQEL